MKSENAIGIAEAMYAMYEGLYSYIPASRVQFKSLGPRWWWGPSTGLQCHIEGPYSISGWSPVPHEALVWYWRGYTGSQGAVEVSRW